MKKILFITSLMVLLQADYFGKLEPFSTISVIAKASGEVVYVNEKAQFSNIEQKKIIVKIDSIPDEEHLKNLSEVKLLSKLAYKISKVNYESKKNLKSVGQYEKNDELSKVITKKQSYLNNIQAERDLKEVIKNKNISAKVGYVGKIYAKVGEYINQGDVLFDFYDTSRSKIIIFVNKKDLPNLKQKTVLINSKESSFKFASISKVNDKKRLSSYEVILTSAIYRPKIYGQLVKIDFK